MVASALLGTLFADYGIVFIFTLLGSIAVAVFGALKRFGKGTVSKWNNRFWKYYGMTAFWCTFLLGHRRSNVAVGGRVLAWCDAVGWHVPVHGVRELILRNVTFARERGTGRVRAHTATA